MSRKVFTPETYVDLTGWPLTIKFNGEGERPGWSAWGHGIATGYGLTPTEAVTDLVYATVKRAFDEWIHASEHVVDVRESLDEILAESGLSEADAVADREAGRHAK